MLTPEDVLRGMDEEDEIIKSMEMRDRMNELINSIHAGEFGKEEEEILENMLKHERVSELLESVHTGNFFTDEDAIVERIESNKHIANVFKYLDEQEYILPPIEKMLGEEAPDRLPDLFYDDIELDVADHEPAHTAIEEVNDRQMHIMSEQEALAEGYKILPHLDLKEEDIEDLKDAQENEVLM